MDNYFIRVKGCPTTISGQDCSGQGVCLDGVCTCNGGWGGDACSVPQCPANCSGNGKCDKEGHKCECGRGFAG